MLKRVVGLVVGSVFVFSLAACGDKADEGMSNYDSKGAVSGLPVADGAVGLDEPDVVAFADVVSGLKSEFGDEKVSGWIERSGDSPVFVATADGAGVVAALESFEKESGVDVDIREGVSVEALASKALSGLSSDEIFKALGFEVEGVGYQPDGNKLVVHVDAKTFKSEKLAKKASGPAARLLGKLPALKAKGVTVSFEELDNQMGDFIGADS